MLQNYENYAALSFLFNIGNDYLEEFPKAIIKGF